MKGVKNLLKFNGKETALTNYTIGEDLNYCQLTEGIVYIHQLLAQHGISAHDRVLITNEGTAEWAIKLVGAVTYGAVAVVIPDGVDDGARSCLMAESNAMLDFDSIELDKDFTNMKGETPADFSVRDFSLSDVIMIDYTKDLAWRKFLGNDELKHETVRVSDVIKAARGIKTRYESLRHSRIPSLFLANNSCIDATDVLAAFSIGAHLTLAGTRPSSGTMLKCVKKCRPHFVYLDKNTAERMIRERVYPLMYNSDTSAYMRSAHARRTIYKQIRKRMMFALGGCLMIVCVTGGNRFSPDIESFLQKIDFPYQMV